MNYDYYIIKIKLEHTDGLDIDYYIGDWNDFADRNEDDDVFPYVLSMPITKDILCAAQIDEKEDAEKIAQSIKCIWGFPVIETTIVGKTYH